MYPQSALVKEIDLVDLHSKSDWKKADEMYKNFLQRKMKPPEKQMLFYRYAKYLQCKDQDPNNAIKYYKKAVQIPDESFFRDNSFKELQTLTGLSAEDILAEAESSELSTQLEELDCHYNWELYRSQSIIFSIKDELEDLLQDKTTSWRSQIYNLQGFLEARLGHSSEALTLFTSASENLRGPELLVNYSNLAWLHHERGEHKQSEEYLKRVEALNTEYPTEGDQPHPEVLAEKAFSMMQFHNDKKRLAVNKFELALKQQPGRVEWLSAQCLARVSVQRHREPLNQEVLTQMKRVVEQDPENLELQAEYLCQQLRNQRGCRREERSQLSTEGEDMEEESTSIQSQSSQLSTEAAALADLLLQKPVSLHRDIKAVLELQRKAVSLEAAMDLAEKAVQMFPHSRYLKSCLSMSLKWQVDQQRETASQELIERTASELEQVIRLYPNSCFGHEIDLANVLAKSNHSLCKADRLYQDLLQRELEPVNKQMLYHNYANFLKFDKQDKEGSLKYHMKTVEIPVRTYFRNKSIEILEKSHPKNRELSRRIEDCLRNIQQ